MKVLVVGGNGMLGRKTVAHLLRDEQVAEVVSMDLAPPPAWFLESIKEHTGRFRYERGDVSQLEDLLDLISTHGIDRLVNWAMVMSLDPQPRLNVKVGVLGMCNVFEAARITGIKRVVYASSETVYGRQEDYGEREVTEDDRLYTAGHFYAYAKRMAEIVAEQYEQLYGIRPTALRPAIVSGHGGKDPYVVRWFSDIVSAPAVGRPLEYDIDGCSPWSLTSPDDIGEFTRLLLHADASPHPAYNLGGPPTSLRDVAEVVQGYLPDARISFGEEQGKEELPWLYSAALAKEDFGFEQMTLQQAVLVHINDARLEAGLPAIAAPAATAS
jgi:nucleoside-diphosphate-sugar epimerase